MMAIHKVNRRDFLTGLAAALLLMSSATASAQENPNPGIFPPGSSPYGRSYGEWSAKFWQWALSLPVNYNPLTDTAPADTAQEGEVWYIGGSFASSTDVTGQTTAIAKRSPSVYLRGEARILSSRSPTRRPRLSRDTARPSPSSVLPRRCSRIPTII